MLRDLNNLEQEIGSYPKDQSIWVLSGEIKNTGGNLCLHLCGNLQHFIGAVLGKTGYKRNRESEFSRKDVPTPELLAEIRRTRSAVEETLSRLDDSILGQRYPEDVFGEPMTTQYFLMHLAGHLTYHLGQINYHRRLLANPK